MHLMKGGTGVANFDRVYRAYFSAINPSDIAKAYNSLGKPDKNQALAVDARQELDLRVGVAFSRFQTRFFQGRYGDLDSSVLSYGPCQTPTLGFCVQRHIDIETFKSEPCKYISFFSSVRVRYFMYAHVCGSKYPLSISTDWVLELGVLKRGRMLRALWASGRSFNKGKTEGLVTKALEESTTVIVSSVVTKENKQGRPSPLNTVALLKACSKALGIGPHAAMQSAERLYLLGYLSYPRT
jgi:DNA topoisomerase-3